VLSRARRWLRWSDPGLFRARNAARTLLAVLAVLGVFHRADAIVRLFAAIAAGMLLQCPAGGSRRREIALIVATGAAMAALIALGVLLGQHPVARPVLLVAGAFFAFYMRRFGPDLGPPSLFSFILLLLATAFPGDLAAALHRALAVLAATAVAAAAHAFLLPVRPRAVRADLLHAAGDRVAALLSALAAGGDVERPLRRLETLSARGAALAGVLPDGGAGEASLVADLSETAHALFVLRRNAAALAELRPLLAEALAALSSSFAGLCDPAAGADPAPAIDALERAAAGPDRRCEEIVQAAIAVNVARRLAAVRDRFAAALGAAEVA
jgi:hypothetical protein